MDDRKDTKSGQEIGNYRILEEVDSGHFGTVYKGEHIVFIGKVVALKVLHSRYTSAEEQASFLREARLLEQLRHPHILSIIDAGFHEKRPYLVSDYAPQGSLRKRLKLHEKQPLAPDEALRILSQVGEGLFYAHQQNIVHRDLKPDNILGDALLADFGIATVLSAGGTSVQHVTKVIGTPYYMAPEQFKGRVSRRSDQYSLGCVAYELLTGRPPFDGSEMYELAYKHMSELPPDPTHVNPDLSTSASQVILQALEKEHGKRYSDVLAFIQALDEAIEPKSREVWLDKAMKFLENKQYIQSLEAFEHALHFDAPPAVVYGGKALTLYHLGRYQEAHEIIKRALQVSPRQATFYYAEGLIFESLQRYADALQSYERAIHFDAGYKEARQKREKLLQRMQR